MTKFQKTNPCFGILFYANIGGKIIFKCDLYKKNQQKKFNGRKMLDFPCEEERETYNSDFIRSFVLLSECIAHLSFWSNLEMPPILDPPMSEKFLLSLELLSQKVVFISQLFWDIGLSGILQSNWLTALGR